MIKAMFDMAPQARNSHARQQQGGGFAAAMISADHLPGNAGGPPAW